MESTPGSAAASLPTDLTGWLDYIEALHPRTIAMGLERVHEVRQRLLPTPEFPIIIVAGTNGKGSTCAMLESIYQQAGYRSACYSSPHLLRYNERVRIDGQDASDAQLVQAFHAVEAARADTQLTYFEYGTLAAMWLFMQADIDIAILEVGLGGKLDAVNAFEPSCSIVTSIDLDHIEYLGNSRESIGFEKAGVFRHGVPAICGDLEPPMSLVAHADNIGTPLLLLQRDFQVKSTADGWVYTPSSGASVTLPFPALIGGFQLNNAACAVGAVMALQLQVPVTQQQIAAGLRAVRLAGRFQHYLGKPQVIVDVAHNPHAARSLAVNLQAEPCRGNTLAVFAMLADKDMAGVIQAIAPVVDNWYVASIDNVRGAQADELARLISTRYSAKPLKTFTDVAAAFDQACLDAGENDRIVALGSFYTVADVMRALPVAVHPAVVQP